LIFNRIFDVFIVGVFYLDFYFFIILVM